MNTTPNTPSLPDSTVKSLTLRAAGHLDASLNHLLTTYGTDLDHQTIRDEIADLDTWLAGNVAPDAHNDYINQLDAGRAPGGVAAVALAKRLGAPIGDPETPHDPPKLASKRHMHDIEVLLCRYVAATHNARAAALVGALEQGATTRELSSLKPSHAGQWPHGVEFDLPGTAAKDAGCITLPSWTGVTMNGLIALTSSKGTWLLTNSTSQSEDTRNSAVMMNVRWVLKEALGWTRPSPASFIISAARRTFARHGLDAAHALLRYRDINNTGKVLGL